MKTFGILKMPHLKNNRINQVIELEKKMEDIPIYS